MNKESIILIFVLSLFFIAAKFSSDAHKDGTTLSNVSITYEHHEIHDGKHFISSHYAVVADASTMEILIETPDTTTWAHMIIEVHGSLETTVQLYEATTKTKNTDLDEINNNRNSSTSATIDVSHTPGGAGDGNLLYGIKFGSDGGPGGKSPFAFLSRSSREFVLKQNTDYLLKITSGAANNNVSVVLSWYEHEDAS